MDRIERTCIVPAQIDRVRAALLGASHSWAVRGGECYSHQSVSIDEVDRDCLVTHTVRLFVDAGGTRMVMEVQSEGRELATNPQRVFAWMDKLVQRITEHAVESGGLGAA